MRSLSSIVLNTGPNPTWIDCPIHVPLSPPPPQVLKEAGLTSDTVGNCMKFFELSKDDVHAFSCDCTGHISTHRMASRIRHLKSSQPPSSSVLSRLMGWFRA
jgi:hypothetical protein